MSAYTSQAMISGYISGQNLINLTDDNGTGSVDQGVLSSIIMSVSSTIDGLLAPTYQTPFKGTPPNLVTEAATQFACEALMGRRLVPGEVNPFKERAKAMWELLKNVAQNRGGLDNAAPAAFNPGYVQATCSLVNSSTA